MSARGPTAAARRLRRLSIKAAMAVLTVAALSVVGWRVRNERTAVRAEGDSAAIESRRAAPRGGDRARGDDAAATARASDGAEDVPASPWGDEPTAPASLPALDGSLPPPAADGMWEAQDETTPAAAEADLRERLQQAEERRDLLAQRVAALRARTDSPEITSARQYERLQDEIKAAFADLDRARAEIGRLRRAVGQ